MVEQVLEHLVDDITPDISHIITEDDEPVDNIASPKKQRCMVNPLYDTEVLKRPFFADVNVASFMRSTSRPLFQTCF